MSAPARRRAQKIFWTFVALVLFAVLVAGAILLLSGGRFFIIRTPSMGEYAPVGTLVFSTVFAYQHLQVGDMIVFHPPGTTETYFHRIHSIVHGIVATKGDINGSVDPWRITAHDIVGHEAARFVGVGWFIQGLPYIIIGAVALHILVHFYVPFLARFPTLIVGYSVMLSIVSLILKPFVRGVIDSQLVEHGKATIIFVSTGLLGLHLQATGGTGVNLVPGQVGKVVTEEIGKNGRFNIELGLHLSPLGWAGMIAVWLIPLGLCAGYAVVARRRGWDLIETVEPRC